MSGIVLTGDERRKGTGRKSLLRFAADRRSGVALYKEQNRKILISGGDLKLISRPIRRGKLAAEFLIKCGVGPPIILEIESVNTYENAKFTAKLLKLSYPTNDFIGFFGESFTTSHCLFENKM
jgi:uncharacterized SAM-binding protein YcdF (DUF218 family)